MMEFIITNEMRERINDFLGYELIRHSEIGHHIYDEAPGLGRIGIEGNELGRVATNKQLDTSGNVEWFKTPISTAKSERAKPFHCQLTSVSAKKAKILIASLFPDEAIEPAFMEENGAMIAELRSNLKLISQPRQAHARGPAPVEPRKAEINPFLLSPMNEMFVGALYYSGEEQPPFIIL